jgi:glycosyl transferase family 25
MQIYVINLTRATERRQVMEQQAQTLGMTFNYLAATDGHSLTDADRGMVDHERRKRITPYPLTDNEIGCWLSHRRAMQQLLDSRQRMAAIVEDDAVLSSDFPKVLEAIENLGEPFDVIDLHTTFTKTDLFLPCRPLIPGCHLGRSGGSTHSNTAYVISCAGAQKFLKYASRFVHAVDKELHRYWANGLDIYCLQKPVAVPDDHGYSYIDETRWHDRPKGRLRYPDANGLYWQLQRRWTKICDSVQKRKAFAAYVRSDQTTMTKAVHVEGNVS